MQAMALEAFGQPLRLIELPVPQPGPGEVLVRVHACGICQTDLKILDGRHASSPRVRFPHVPGHEVAGEVAETGPGVTSVQRGDRVVVNIYDTCGVCRYCQEGRESLCEHLGAWIGFDAPGGMAEYVSVPAKNLVKVSADVPSVKLAVLGDAIGTSLRAVKTRAAVRAGETVVICGLGGVGVHALQIAKHCGATVVALDVVPEKLAQAKELGADWALDARRHADAEILARTDGRGADVALDFTGLSDALATCAASLRSGGRLVMVGYQADSRLQLPTQSVVLQELEVLGSRYCNRQELTEAARLVAEGVVTPVIGHTLPLTSANEGLAMIRRGTGMGRIVIQMLD
ncbi:MAG: alcohol dehydrogenase catalytic domain-containing protein [Alicyclobacillus sp.]|nr:alcohol dehydrogenase catalytic domain-containing protein [Alicyclobacillus sp.]